MVYLKLHLYTCSVKRTSENQNDVMTEWKCRMIETFTCNLFLTNYLFVWMDGSFDSVIAVKTTCFKRAKKRQNGGDECFSG